MHFVGGNPSDVEAGKRDDAIAVTGGSISSSGGQMAASDFAAVVSVDNVPWIFATRFGLGHFGAPIFLAACSNQDSGIGGIAAPPPDAVSTDADNDDTSTG